MKLTINTKENKPKYKLLVEAIINSIDNEEYKHGDILPSINKICKIFNYSRDTVLLALKELKSKGIIVSVSGKGYYVKSTQTGNKYRIFLLFDELNIFKEDLYNSIVKNIGNKAEIDIFFHHFNYDLFCNLIKESVGRYTSYVVMPATFNDLTNILAELPTKSTYILDRKKNIVSKTYTTIYQDFNKGTYFALKTADEFLKKYKRLIMLYPGGKEPYGRKLAFLKYSEENNYENDVKSSVLDILKVEKGDVFFVHNDRELVNIIKKIKLKKLELGNDVGIISFNDTILHEIVANGISVISTDFKEMGKTLAETIINKTYENIEIPTHFIKRNSL